MDDNNTQLETKIEKVKVQKMPKNTLYFLIALVLFTVILLVVAVYNYSLVGPSVPNEQNVTVVSQTQTKLTIVSPVTTVKNGSFSSLSSINIDTGGNKVTAVEMHLSFNPAVFENVDINGGTFISNPTVLLKKVDPKKGTIDYSIAVTNNKDAKSGAGSVAVLTFTTKKNVTGETSFKFSPGTIVTASNLVQSVLKSKSASSITLSNF